MRRLVPLLLLLAAPAAAYAESDAGSLDDRVEKVWHEPDVVRPGTQWEGFLRLKPGHGVDSAYYQICTVGDQCFAPPTHADRLDDVTFGFDTRDYTASGEPVRYEAGWHIGVKWCLQNATAEAGDCEWIPDQAAGRPPEDHYFTFRIPGDKDSPTAPGPLVAALLLIAVTVRRGR